MNNINHMTDTFRALGEGEGPDYTLPVGTSQASIEKQFERSWFQVRSSHSSAEWYRGEKHDDHEPAIQSQSLNLPFQKNLFFNHSSHSIPFHSSFRCTTAKWSENRTLYRVVPLQPQALTWPYTQLSQHDQLYILHSAIYISMVILQLSICTGEKKENNCWTWLSLSRVVQSNWAGFWKNYENLKELYKTKVSEW